MESQTHDAAAQLIAGGVGVFVLLCIALILAFAVFLFWRILTKAGMPGPLGLLAIIPLGAVILLCILAFGKWNVVPVPPQYGALPPYPPPPMPPAAPPQGYPPVQS